MIKKSIFFYCSIQQITRFPDYLNIKSSDELAVLFLRQFDVPISWKERLFYFQRDYAIFISLQCINFRPTEYEGFETEPLFVCFCVLFWLLLLFFFLNISFFHNLILMTITIAQEILFLKNDIFYFFLRFFV